ncbi:MAG: polysaccharide deacetylase family protein [Bacteroidota bacterium]
MNRDRIKKTAYNLTRPFSFRFLRNMTGQRFVFPFYHFVGEKHPPHLRHLYRNITPEQFRSDLEFLLKHYQPASVTDLKQFIAGGKKTNRPLFFLSFDDGLKECFEIVAPVLKQKGIQAAFFVNPDFIGNQSMFFRFKTSLLAEKILHGEHQISLKELASFLGEPTADVSQLTRFLLCLNYFDAEKIDQAAQILKVDFKEWLATEKPYMTMQQLNQLNTDGFLIGAHSMNHPLFEDLSEKEQINQISESIGFVREHFKPEISAFAFPFTDAGVPSVVFKHIDNAENIDVTFGTAGIKNDSSRKHIQRIPMDEFNLAGGQKILRAEYSYYLFKSIVRKNKIRR